MSKFSKLICCLVIPIVAMFAFAGCKGKARTGADIQNRYIAMKTTHSDMFEKVEGQEGVLLDTVRVNYNDTFTLGLKRINNLVSEAPEFENDTNLFKRYFAMKNVQDLVLKNIFVYYNAYSVDFYEGAQLKGISKGEMKKLYNSVETLQNDIADFKVARNKLENTCDILTFSGVIRSDVTEYAYHYNMLIEDCLKFVRYFKELNEKYYFSDQITEETNDEERMKYVKYYYNEATFEMADMMYNVYLKSLNHVNECDLSKLIQFSEINDRALVKQVYATGELYSAIRQDVLIDKIAKMTGGEGVDPEITSVDKDKYNNFLEIRNVYLQKKRVYNVVIDRMDYYQFSDQILGSEVDYKFFYDKLSNLEQANINLVLNFYKTTLMEYVNSIVGLV